MTQSIERVINSAAISLRISNAEVMSPISKQTSQSSNLTDSIASEIHNFYPLIGTSSGTTQNFFSLKENKKLKLKIF